MRRRPLSVIMTAEKIVFDNPKREGTTMRDTIRWGVMGTGWIAEKFCGALRSLEGYGAQLYAVGSRKKETADAFAARHGFARLRLL